MVTWLEATVFVTGGSGFVGGAVIKSLALDNTVRALARSQASAATVARLGATPVMSSLGDVRPEHLEGCQTVVHCAAEAKEWALPGLYESTNITGTTRLLDAARSAGVRRFVHISTDSVLCTGGPLHSVDEAFPLPAKSPFRYAATKAAGERAVIDANDPPNFETVAIRPCLVWGQGDTTVVPEIRAMVAKRQFLWIGGGHHRISTTNIGNLTAGIRLAMGRSGAGEVFYITDNEPMEMRSFVTRYMSANGTELPTRSIPAAPAALAALVIESLWKLFRPRSQPPLTRFAVALLSKAHYIETDKALLVLGYRPLVTIDAGMAAVRLAAGA